MEEKKLQLFTNKEFGQVRSLMSDGEPYFVGKDIAEILGYKDTSDALKKHVDEDDKMGRQIADSLGRLQNTIFINESGLYSLVLKSKLPQAKKFRKWVTSEVLPNIRKTGGFVESGKEEDFIKNYFPSFSDDVKLAMVLDLRKKNEELKHKSDAWDQFVGSNNTYSFEEVAKMISTHAQSEGSSISVIKLTALLRDKGVLNKAKTKHGYKNTPNQGFEEYFNVTSVKTNGNFETTQTRVKSSGLTFVYDVVKEKLVA